MTHFLFVFSFARLLGTKLFFNYFWALIKIYLNMKIIKLLIDYENNQTSD